MSVRGLTVKDGKTFKGMTEADTIESPRALMHRQEEHGEEALD